MNQFITHTAVYLASLNVLSRQNLLWSIVSKFYKTFSISIYKGYRYTFHNYGEILQILYSYQTLTRFGKGFEYKTVEKFIELVKPGGVILDVGANIGMYSLFASDLVGSSGKVYAFEPVKDTFNALSQNLDLNNKPNVILNKLALSDEEGKAQIKVPEHANDRKVNDAFNSLHFGDNITGGETIDMQTLDMFVKENNITKIDFIKVDIEGAELLFFKGALRTLAEIKPTYIIFEAYEPFCKRFNYTVSDIIVLLDGSNYVIEQYDDWQWLATLKQN